MAEDELTQRETLYTKQGATFSYGFVAHELQFDGDGAVIVDGDGNPVPGDPIPFPDGTFARMQIRKKVNSAEFMVYATSGEYDADDAPFAGRITIQDGDETGRIDIVLTDADTDLITATEAVFDLEIVWPLEGGEIRAQVDRILEGDVVNDLNVTR